MRRELQRILEILISRYQPEKIILFGSLATGEITEESDLDLLIIKETTRRPIERVMEIDALLGHPRIALDVLVYTPKEIEYLQREGSQFIEDILSSGLVLYEKDH